MIYFVAIIEDNQNVFVEPYLLFQSVSYLELDSNWSNLTIKMEM